MSQSEFYLRSLPGLTILQYHSQNFKYFHL